MMVFDDVCMRRRRLLTVAGGTVTIALAGCLDEDDEEMLEDDEDVDDDEDIADDGDDADNGDDDSEEVEPDLEGITIDVDEPVIEVEDEAVATVIAQYDDGSEETVTDEAIITSDDESIASVADGAVTGEAEGTITLLAEYEGFEDTVEVETEDDDEEDAEPFELGDSFEAEGVGGYISFAEDTEAEAEEEGLAFPTADEDGEAIVVEATVDGERWESTSVEFPDVDTGTAEAAIAAVDGLSGEIDLDSGTMTAEGTLEVTVEGDDSFEFAIAATTDNSGELSGEVDAEFTPAAVTVVDNEFIVEDETGNVIVDNVLDLPADEPGENWLTLTFELTSE